MKEGLKVFTVAELKIATKDFGNQMVIGESLGYINPKTLSPAKEGTGMAVAVKRIYLANEQALQDWLVSNYHLRERFMCVCVCVYIYVVFLKVRAEICRLT